MTLYEITTTKTTNGASYERCYVWTDEGEEEARNIFYRKYPESEIEEVTRLFDDDEGEFITNLSSDGFDTEDVV